MKPDYCLVRMPEIIVNTSKSNDPGMHTEYTLNSLEASKAIELLIDAREDQLREIAERLMRGD